jgi:hypothetical protein
VLRLGLTNSGAGYVCNSELIEVVTQGTGAAPLASSETVKDAYSDLWRYLRQMQSDLNTAITRLAPSDGDYNRVAEIARANVEPAGQVFEARRPHFDSAMCSAAENVLGVSFDALLTWPNWRGGLGRSTNDADQSLGAVHREVPQRMDWI